MKKIINNKVYDTEKAEKIGTWDNGDYSDLNRLEESLYRKRTGEYFVYGEGGATTRYAKTEGDHWMGGRNILPVSYRKAREWAEKHLDPDTYEDVFGEVSEGEDVISTVIDAASKSKLERTAAELGITQREALQRFLAMELPTRPARTPSMEDVREHWDGDYEFREWWALDEYVPNTGETIRHRIGQKDQIVPLAEEYVSGADLVDPAGDPAEPGEYGSASFYRAILISSEDARMFAFGEE